ncbi:MAG: ABC transporter permease [Candidatus Kapaibacterium sp.]
MMLLKLAWRNLWRNSRRSVIVLISIVVGVAALLLIDSLGQGMINQMLNNQIAFNIGHIQIHGEGFSDNKEIDNFIKNKEKVKEIASGQEFVKDISERIITNGMINSAGSSSGIQIYGVEHDKEKKVSTINQRLAEGEYLSGRDNEILLGIDLAEDLDVKLNDKVVLTAAGFDGKISQDLYRVSGIFKTGSSQYDQIYAYVNLSDADEMLSMGGRINELAIITESTNNVSAYRDSLAADLKAAGLDMNEYEALTFRELLPLLIAYIDIYNQTVYLFYAIIIAAIMFSVINTMLMAVFERIHEFGVLMSIGMLGRKIFTMLAGEALFLGMIGTAGGFILGLLIYWPLTGGLDLSIYSESLKDFGIGSVIYPELNLSIVLNALILMPASTVLGAVYPAMKAIKLEPTEAVRYV